jgi:hypothetical protein
MLLREDTADQTKSTLIATHWPSGGWMEIFFFFFTLHFAGAALCFIQQSTKRGSVI